jgi:DNA-binding PadR family transcriptional regulator
MSGARLKSGLSLGEYAILGVLRERPMHGYEVTRRFSAEFDLGLVLPLEMSNVYAMLKDLHEQGLIEGRRETVGLRPPRTVYQLTDEADALFLHWLQEPVGRLREVRSDLLTKLYFCRAIGDRCSATLLDAQIVVSRGYRDRLTRLAEEAAPGSFERLVRDSKIGAARATVAWLEEERARLAG